MKVAVLGAGTIGQLRARSIRQNPQTELVAVADPDRGAAERAAAGSGAAVFADFAELLTAARVDAVVVSTPVHLHEAMAIAALESGAHVLCEKPLSNSVESCRRILETSSRRQRTLAVGFNQRYYPAVRFLKQVIDDGRIGRLDHVRVFGGHDGLSNFRADWMYKAPLSGGGAMMDIGIHMTDLARFVIGELAEVYGVATEQIWKVPGSEDNAVAIMKGESGVCALYQATWSEWKGYKIFIEAYGDLGMVRASYAPMFNLLVTQDRPGGPRQVRRQFYPEIIVREKLRGWQSTTYGTFEAELADFLRRLDGEPVPLADGWAGLRAVEVAAAVHESTRKGLPVALSRPDSACACL